MVRSAISMLALGATLMAAPAWAATYWEDQFNNWSNWDHAPSNPAITTCPTGFGSGTCYKGTFGSGGDFVDRTFTPSSEIWVRFNYRLDNFTVDSIGTKIFYMAHQSYIYPNFYTAHLFSDRRMVLVGQIVAENCGTGGYDTCNYYPNMADIPIQNGQNYCIEVHVKFNTPGVADGQLEMFIDGTQTMNYTGRVFRGPSSSNPSYNSSTATMNAIREFVQDGNGTMWQDNLAVGNTRIGCSGSTPKGDTTPPATPTGLSAS